MPLSRPAIVEAALRLLDEEGLDRLTTRRLGEALGVEGPALYRHFSTKQDLFDEMASELFRAVRELPIADDWADTLATRARLTRRAMLSHRDGGRLIANAWPKPLDMETITQPFRRAGFSYREALYAHMVIGRFVIGWTNAEQALRDRETRPDSTIDNEDAFEFGLETIIAGLRLRLLAPPRRPDPHAA